MTDEFPASEREALRRTFDSVPELYDRARPSYPAELFVDIEQLAALARGAPILEIGPGTGQATLPFAQRGYRVTAVELGDDLADFLRRKLSTFANVHIETSSFERWTLPDEPFALAFIAQAFHWLDPSIRLRKLARALHDHGALALFGHQHIAGGDRAFFEEVQACYERYMPGTPPGLRLTEADARAHEYANIGDVDGLFEPPILRSYRWQQSYSTAEYLDVLNTYSGHIQLEVAAHHALFECIATLIDSHFGGRIRKAYITYLAVARKR